MKQILIVEPDKQFAGRLFQALLQAGDYQISSAATAREACLIVGRQQQDLAFIPPAGLEETVEALRRLQPTLPLVVTTAEAGEALPASYAGQVQGTLPRSALALTLPRLLETVWDQPVPAKGSAAEADPAGIGHLVPLLQGSALPEAVLTVLVSQGERLLAHAGTLAGEQARLVAERVGASWQPDLTAQLQFVLLPSRTSDLQLYTRSAGGGLLLTLVARAETRMEVVRAEADRLVAQVREAVGIPGPPTTGSGTAPALTVRVPELELQTEKSYALLWRARAPLPDPLRIALGRGIERIATRNECKLTYLSIEEELIHMVVRCPAERNSAWVAHRFKEGTETAIQAQFGVEAVLWQEGYYAVESDEPVSEAELNLIKRKDA